MQRAQRVGEMLQKEAHEEVVEAAIVEGEVEDIGDAERDIAAVGGFDAAAGLIERRG
jgi:hypothetical protein